MVAKSTPHTLILVSGVPPVEGFARVEACMCAILRLVHSGLRRYRYCACHCWCAGIVNDIAISQLLAEGNAGAFDAVIHAGDFAYNMEDDSGKIGDEFMNSVQPYAARYPYMGSPGNHEASRSQRLLHLTLAARAPACGMFLAPRKSCYLCH